ncbi:MAG: metallophosphoesterase family protein [Candidatus Eisenbacteria bacterium]|nr:metallophosphoesterase family protein [Candidatus Eisenbacteria bacterium]
MRVGLISDTHGLVRPEAIEALRGSDLILHAGDVGTPEVLEKLRALAPVVAVRGNADRGAWAQELPVTTTVEAGRVLIHLLHDRHALDISAAKAGIAAVVSGHSHYPTIRRKDGVLWINPGSAGPRRLSLPVCLGHLTITENQLEARIQEL